MRLLQGVAIGGEWGGATLMSMEHAKNVGFFSLVSGGYGRGAGTLVMTFYVIANDQFWHGAGVFRS